MNSAAVRRELLWLTAAAAVGVLLLPPLIYVVGRRVLGAYEGGGAADLIGHFFRGLAGGSVAFWAVAAGPYVCLTLARLIARLVAAAPASRAGED